MFCLSYRAQKELSFILFSSFLNFSYSSIVCMFLSLFSLPRAEVSERDTAVFLVKGLSIGQTTISAVVVDKNSRKIASAPQQIEVLTLKDFNRLLLIVWNILRKFYYLTQYFFATNSRFPGVSSVQAHSQENDFADWRHDAGTCLHGRFALEQPVSAPPPPPASQPASQSSHRCV